jgi:hypothetical protein
VIKSNVSLDQIKLVMMTALVDIKVGRIVIPSIGDSYCTTGAVISWVMNEFPDSGHLSSLLSSSYRVGKDDIFGRSASFNFVKDADLDHGYRGL